MRQRIPLYATAFLILAAAYMACLDEGWTDAATVVLIVAFVAIAVGAVYENHVHERDCVPHIEEHVGFVSAEHVREVLGEPDPAEVTAPIPVQREAEPAVEPVPEVLPVEAAVRADMVQDEACRDEITDRYQAYMDAGMAAVDAIASGEVAMELGVA